MMQIAKVVTQKKRNLKCKQLFLSQKKAKQITRKKKQRYQKKGNNAKDKLLPQDNSGKNANEEPISATSSTTAAYNTNSESDWEISDFFSSENSCDEWLP